MGLVSPALDVPPEAERPNKRAKLEPLTEDTSQDTSRAVSPAPGGARHLDLAERLDAEERAKYVKGAKLGSGQYADVYSAHLKTDPSQLVAIKKIKVGAEFEQWGVSLDSIREIKFLQELDHPNIIKLYSVFSTKNQNLNLVLEQLPQGDLLKLIQDTADISYTPADIKAWMLMLSRAVHFCHVNHILHRDIKPNNLLIAANGEIKLADFGLARYMADPYEPMTYNTITIWYRPPEMFFQSKFYSGKVDVWSCGAVFAELIARDVMFRAIPDTEINMINLICEKVGTPTEDNWPGVSKLPTYTVPSPPTPLKSADHWRAMFPSVGPTGVDLLMKMLSLDPRKRLSAQEVLEHDYWTAEPRPSRLEDLPRKGGGLEAMGEELTKMGGELPGNGKPTASRGRADGVARKLDFAAMAK
ncbi:serine/threonine protein kinase, CMGC family, CDC2/CDK subfamily [Polychaeton citri CBS 116435]|uniref:Serine/threonine protein kinase, CMGC family, CDC2/CDK subfamily n=1 Tax=Polychaeton citri CBS 116435 TaxID=1314669 RepID=A0A9P4PZ83_9PEZI|nr:serine/threonine protein kinase, CMGC family, CDC2/CDK subfamily [Polychaeton citri CBS 116435]